MTTTATRARRPEKLPGVPALSRRSRRRLKVRVLQAEIVAGLVALLNDFNDDRLPHELERLEPLYQRAVGRCHRERHRTHGECLRHLADLSDLADVLWDGGAGVEDHDGSEADPADVYPILAQLR